MSYLTPADDLRSVIDSPPPPAVALGPRGEFLALVYYEPNRPVSALARACLPLAGIRIDPSIGGRQRTRGFAGLSVTELPSGEPRRIELGAGRSMSAMPAWAPDGHQLTFMVDEPDEIAVWVADARTASAAPVPGVSVRDVLASGYRSLGSTVQWSRDSRSLLLLGSPGLASVAATPAEPRVAESIGKSAKLATFADLLRTEADEDTFEALAATVPLRVDPVSGSAAELGPPGLYYHLSESPDGKYLLVGRLCRPFSFLVPFPYFSRRLEVWSACGGLRRMIADLPVSDTVRRHGVPTGPRMVAWEEAAPASLIWAEALDGGDSRVQAAYRDRLLRLHAPFDAEPEVALLMRHRCLGWRDLPGQGQLLLTEHDLERRWLTTRWHDLSAPSAPLPSVPGRVIFDRSADEAYLDPGEPMMTVHRDGSRTILADGSYIYLSGTGASQDGDQPFLDRFDLDSLTAKRLFSSPDGSWELVHGFADGARSHLLTWRDSRDEPPHPAVVALETGTRRQLAAWRDPHPELTRAPKRLLSYDRGDGVRLTGMLHLPPGYEPQRDGPLPLLIWAYPREYSDAATAGQVRGTARRFIRLRGSDPSWLVLRRYAVLRDATMPVIGGSQMLNDSFVEQVTAAAAAHVEALCQLGIADRARIAVGGHSYGAFMTANLLAHTDLFAAGIAWSGAYNRTLTPFGFQAERRSFWEAPEIYDKLSPFRHADKITAPLLLIHGLADANSGTFPIQSETLFRAIQGNGGTARLVLLPHEGHTFVGRESLLHVMAEQVSWLDRWLAPRPIIID